MLPVHHTAHARALRYSTLTLCFVMVLAGLPFDARVQSQGNSNANQDGPRTKGAPGPNLPNLDQTKAEGARNEKQPDITPLPPVGATRCRHHDTKCKETKEKKSSLAPSYDRFSHLWAAQRTSAKLFAWQESTLPPAIELQPDTNHNASFALAPAATSPRQDDFTAQRRAFEKMRQRLPRAAASSLLPPVWQSSNGGMERIDEINRTGAPGEDLYSGNYHWSIPLLSLPGRAGHDLNLRLCYNSLTWLKVGNAMYYDWDNNLVSPGGCNFARMFS